MHGPGERVIEPLESTAIHLIQVTIQRLILLFPHHGDYEARRLQFNRSAAAEYEYIRDFIILHYYANNRVGEPFWDACRNMSIPDSLAHKLELFRETAGIFCASDDLFQLSSWLQVMWGQGLRPRGTHPFVEAIAPQRPCRLPARPAWAVCQGGSRAAGPRGVHSQELRGGAGRRFRLKREEFACADYPEVCRFNVGGQFVKKMLLVLGVLFANESIACSCVRTPDIARTESGAELVVVAEIEDSGGAINVIGKRKYVFATVKAFKGSGRDTVVVWTERYEMACGLKARGDVPYVLLVYREDKKLMVDKCSSWPLTREYSDYADAFNDFYKLTGPDALKVDSNAE